MKMCKCGRPTEAERYQFCYPCWFAQDPRNACKSCEGKGTYSAPASCPDKKPGCLVLHTETRRCEECKGWGFKPENFHQNNATRHIPTVEELTAQFMRTLPSSMGGPILESIARAFAVQHRELYITMYNLLK